MLWMSFLHVGIADIYQTIHTLTNPKTAKACFGVLICNCPLSSLPSTIDGPVQTLRSINKVIKVLSSYSDTIGIGNTSYEYELIWSKLSTNRFLSPTACESALSYTNWVCNGLMIVANDRTLNSTALYWSQIYSILQLNSFAIYWMESIPRHPEHMNHKSHSPQTKKVWFK